MLALTVCVGMVLWAWTSEVTLSARTILLPVVIAQLFVFTGMVLLMRRLRVAVRTLRQEATSIHQRIDGLEKTTHSLAASLPSSSQAFYGRLAQAGSPHLLLADIRGQLDQLSLRLTND